MINVTKNEGGVILKLSAPTLDRVNAPELRAIAAEAVNAGSQWVEVDCSTLEFIDSSGVGALLHVNNLLDQERRPVRLTGVSGTVLSVLELVRVHRLFAVEPK